MPDDIVKEWNRGSKLKCFYCKEIYASVGCSVQTCIKSFHLPCGIKNGSIHEYYGNFDSFCTFHISKSSCSKRQEEFVLTDLGLVPSSVYKESEKKEQEMGKTQNKDTTQDKLKHKKRLKTI